MEESSSDRGELFKPEKSNWAHYFGGFGLIAIMLQLTTGIYLIFFYEPTLEKAYKSVQYITNEVFMGSFARNLHRWVPALLASGVIIHAIRSFLRSDYRKKSKRVLWMTGVLMMLPLFLFLVTGLIVPWEWKGYWFMEMIPNYFETVPFFGTELKAFFLDTFTVPRYYVIHVVLLPLITIVLVDYHMLSKLRRRGVFRYLLKHIIITLPLLILLVVLALKVTIPSNDPMEIPMPLAGAWIPEPEWFFLTILLPFMYTRGAWLPWLLMFIPLILFFALAFLPFVFRSQEKEAAKEDSEPHKRKKSNALIRFWHNLNNTSMKRKVINALFVTILAVVINGLIYLGNYNSPTLGCNSCHNVSRGIRMGIPPNKIFKDRNQMPVLENNEWMMGHWYYPNEIW